MTSATWLYGHCWWIGITDGWERIIQNHTCRAQKPFTGAIKPSWLWTREALIPPAHLVAIQLYSGPSRTELGICTHFSLLPDIIPWIQWTFRHPQYNLPKAVALALEILPVDLWLSFKDVRQQNWIGIGWTRWCLVSNSVTAKYRYKTIWWRREHVCRLTQPCSLSCRNADAFFSWTENRLWRVGFPCWIFF